MPQFANNHQLHLGLGVLSAAILGSIYPIIIAFQSGQNDPANDGVTYSLKGYIVSAGTVIFSLLLGARGYWHNLKYPNSMRTEAIQGFFIGAMASAMSHSVSIFVKDTRYAILTNLGFDGIFALLLLGMRALVKKTACCHITKKLTIWREKKTNRLVSIAKVPTGNAATPYHRLSNVSDSSSPDINPQRSGSSPLHTIDRYYQQYTGQKRTKPFYDGTYVPISPGRARSATQPTILSSSAPEHRW